MKEKDIKQEAPEKEFSCVYFLPTENLSDPSKISTKFMVKKDEIKDGERVRLYDKRLTEKSGWSAGNWNENVSDYKISLAAWALSEVDRQLETARELVLRLEQAEINWTEFISTLE